MSGTGNGLKEGDIKVRKVSEGAWLKALLADSTRLELNVYRYHDKRKPWHTACDVMKEHLIVFVERGFFKAIINGQKFRLSAGDIIWVPPGCFREFCSARNVSILRHHNIRFSVHAPTASTPGSRPLVFNTKSEIRSQGWDLHSTFQLIQEWFTCSQRHQEVRLRGLLLALSTGFLNLPKRVNRRGGAKQRVLNMAQRRRIQRKVLADLVEGIDPAGLAQSLDLSLDYFTRLFRKTYGVAPRTFLKQERMRLASVRLQESTLSVAQVAQEFGMENVSFFCRQFRDVMGCSPKTYRQRG